MPVIQQQSFRIDTFGFQGIGKKLPVHVISCLAQERGGPSQPGHLHGHIAGCPPRVSGKQHCSIVCCAAVGEIDQDLSECCNVCLFHAFFPSCVSARCFPTQYRKSGQAAPIGFSCCYMDICVFCFTYRQVDPPCHRSRQLDAVLAPSSGTHGMAGFCEYHRFISRFLVLCRRKHIGNEINT